MIAIGDTIYLEKTGEQGENEEAERYYCRLVDRLNQEMVIDVPIHEQTKKPSLFPEGTPFRAHFLGKDGAMYIFESTIKERRRETIPVLVFNDPGPEIYKRIQRRQDVRVSATVDCAIHPTENTAFTPFRATTVDISGGGCAIVLPNGRSLPGDGEIDIVLALHLQSSDMFFVEARCKIVRLHKRHEEALSRVSLQFISIEERHKEKIIRFCFERQLQVKQLLFDS
ncbi:flagellar brake protein [Halalkalibacterium halodurans]|uniref:flagellar brake protein n=1 Tax=Halalkalibacterium halodurans TaxID=86665 RepID=UPI002E214126|nr:flagellar brake protein [Halalkalibacterium halodurans]MED4086469.1 flagellar brake protein [Halalkalibacterium halodurans]MED4104995.1 flagellar brake protein [Halalkalibacterium halodurans]MED4110825.1 flagellar brake protein [Halalkalibacterium halodurans]MED4147597.1 flagellar brake protein [Halalkalibacterium halodurans]